MRINERVRLQLMEDLQAKALNPPAILASIRAFRNTLGGKIKFAFKEAQFDSQASLLISKRMLLALQWRIDGQHGTEELILIDGKRAIQNARRLVS